jgi:hypothetical protein
LTEQAALPLQKAGLVSDNPQIQAMSRLKVSDHLLCLSSFQAGQLRHQKAFTFATATGQTQSSLSNFENIPVHLRNEIIEARPRLPSPSVGSKHPPLESAEQLEDLLGLVPLLSYWSPPSMASESSERLAQNATPQRRTDTPPRSIFDDYQSAYQSILSPARAFTGIPRVVEAADSSRAVSEFSPPENPFADSFTTTHITQNPRYHESAGRGYATVNRRKIGAPSSPKSKRRTNFSRPLNLSLSSDRMSRSTSEVTQDSISIFDLGSLRRLAQDRSPNIHQPNLHGARGRVEKSSTVGSIVKRYGDEFNTNRKSIESDPDVEVRSSLDIMGCSQRVRERIAARPSSSPAGQAPDIPLPPDPSYVAARGIVGEPFSEPSLYENTEKLLNLTQASGADAVAENLASRRPSQSANSVGGGLSSEFSWMGNKGKSSFRDLSTKELKQLRKPVQSQSGDLAREGVDVPVGDESYDDQHLLPSTVSRPPSADQRPVSIDELVRADARRAQILSEQLGSRSLEEESTRSGKPVEADDEHLKPGVQVNSDLHTDSVLDCGGLQSSSSRGVSLEASLRDRPFRPGLYMDETSLASLIGRESADAARMSALVKGKRVIRSMQYDAEDDVSIEGDENEGGEWETVGESGMRSKVETQTSIGRDTSGSSLANVSSNESAEDHRSAQSPWDPLRPYPVLITPPAKAVTHQGRGHVSGVQEPATVPRYVPAGAEGYLERNLNRSFSSTPALTFAATPQYQRRRENSPTYRHPTPLKREHQNPFSSTPPFVDIQNPEESFELSEFADKRRDKRQAVCADSSHSLQQQIHKPTPEKAKSRLKNPFGFKDTSSDKSADGSYSTVYPTNLAVEGTSILNPSSPHTPKSTKSFTRGSFKKTKTVLTGSPRRMILCIHLPNSADHFSSQHGRVKTLSTNS